MAVPVMVAVALAQAAGVVVLHRNGGSRSVLLLGLAFPVILTGLTALGMTRIVALHVPLAVLSVVGLLRAPTTRAPSFCTATTSNTRTWP